MTSTPLVSIVLSMSDDAERIGNSVRSCTSQTRSGVEIICVHRSDAAAADNSTAIGTDSRVRVVFQSPDTSSAEAHRAGVFAASAPYVLFLEPGDELDPEAVAELQSVIEASDPDIVRLGIGALDHDVRPDTLPQNEPRRQHRTLHGDGILRQMFSEETAIGVRAWKLLVRTKLLIDAYKAVPEESTPSLTDDMPIIFLACANASTYASLSERLYRCRPGGDTVSPSAVEQFRAVVSELHGLTSISSAVLEEARHRANPEPILAAFEMLRLATIGDALELAHEMTTDERTFEIAHLRAHAAEIDVVMAAATYAPAALPVLSEAGRIELGHKPVKSVLLTTNILTTGGVSGVLLTQAHFLLGAGYRVTIATHRPGSNTSLVPEGAHLVELSGPTKRDRLFQWAELCERYEIDVVIDHRILYSRDWPGYALAARASRAATIGWIHNFAGRPTYNGNDLHSLMRNNMNALARLIVLSPLDVAFWKLRGVDHVTYLPNPPSPLLLASAGVMAPKRAPEGRRLELVWWGRLEEHTKKVTELVEVAAALKRLDVDFRLRIIGPDWADMTSVKLSALVGKRGLDGYVEVTGPRHGPELLDAIDSSDVFVNTSIIEGYPLTLPEAQSRGLPIAMYELPWLTLTDNAGTITTAQEDPAALASAIAELASNPERYEVASRASIDAAERAADYNFSNIYQQLLSDTLPTEFSPAPTVKDGRRLLELLIFFAERSNAPRPKSGKPRGKKGTTGGSLSPSATLERRMTPLGRNVIKALPWLRPVARRVKMTLLRY